MNHLEFVPKFALFFGAGFGLFALQNQANNKKQEKKSGLTTHGKQRSIEYIWNGTWSIMKNAKIELFWLLLMFILGSDGLHQEIKKNKKWDKVKTVVKCPIFSTFDYSPLAAHGFVEPGMALARFLLLYSDLYQKPAKALFKTSYWLMLWIKNHSTTNWHLEAELKRSINTLLHRGLGSFLTTEPAYTDFNWECT